eukprot:4876804-Heterocapsa_arctica.AAC.1
MAVEWCRRMQHLFDLYGSQIAKDFEYTKEHTASFKVSEAFMHMKDSLPKVGKAMERVKLLEALRPILKIMSSGKCVQVPMLETKKGT